MLMKFNKLLDSASGFFASRKGLIPIIGIILVVINGILQFVPSAGMLAHTNLFLHLGILIALAGFLLAWAL